MELNDLISEFTIEVNDEEVEKLTEKDVEEIFGDNTYDANKAKLIYDYLIKYILNDDAEKFKNVYDICVKQSSFIGDFIKYIIFGLKEIIPDFDYIKLLLYMIEYNNLYISNDLIKELELPDSVLTSFLFNDLIVFNKPIENEDDKNEEYEKYLQIAINILSDNIDYDIIEKMSVENIIKIFIKLFGMIIEYDYINHIDRIFKSIIKISVIKNDKTLIIIVLVFFKNRYFEESLKYLNITTEKTNDKKFFLYTLFLQKQININNLSIILKNFENEADADYRNDIKNLFLYAKTMSNLNKNIFKYINIDESQVEYFIDERKKFLKLISIKPEKSNIVEFIKQCKTNIDIITGEEMDVKNDETLQPIGVISAENDKDMFCFDKQQLIDGFVIPMFLYGSTKGINYIANSTVYKMTYPPLWINEEGLMTLILSKSKSFKLTLLGKYDLGTKFGMSQWHGEHFENVYTINEIDVEL
jgi:hypothetical protein